MGDYDAVNSGILFRKNFLQGLDPDWLPVASVYKDARRSLAYQICVCTFDI